jgi:hypothetical protein
MFLEMHRPLQANLGDLAGHFWYVAPITAAIVILSRLRPRVELLGLAVYDETGQVVHQRGQFCQDQFTSAGMLTGGWGEREHGLHGFSLPSGIRVYL